MPDMTIEENSTEFGDNKSFSSQTILKAQNHTDKTSIYTYHEVTPTPHERDLHFD